MYKTITEAVAFVQALLPRVAHLSAKVYLAVPFTAIAALADLCRGTQVVIGAQNMHPVEQGAFTGEIAGRMLLEAGAQFVILGHSERRRLFHESNEFINKKVLRALDEGLQPLLCIGETAEQRAQGATRQVLTEQIREGLRGVLPEKAASLMLSYEPVWAIGTNQVATVPMIEEALEICRTLLAEVLGSDVAAQLPILYGGSVTAQNAPELFKAGIDGVLVGGASLTVDSFTKIVDDSLST